MSFSSWLFLATAAWSAVCVAGKRLEGSTTLSAGQALVVTKFCFDSNADCADNVCDSPELKPGKLQLTLHSAKRISKPIGDEDEEDTSPEGLASMAKKGLAEFHVALLDDEYFSFPEVSQVWGEANCSDVIKAAKRSFPLQWDQISTDGGQEVETAVVEHLRPRWWYVAIVSCSKTGVDLSYRMHLQNTLRGWEAEFSMDQRYIFEVSFGLCIMFGGLVFVQAESLRRWRQITRRGHHWYEVHPALLLAMACTLFALAGELCIFVNYMRFEQGGESSQLWSIVGRASMVVAQNCMSTLLMILAHGDCVCSVHIRWAQHREMVGGMVLYAVLQLPLELWGDSEFRTTTTEYIYDTRPGMVLIAFNLLWTWMYVSRSWQTYKNETRIKAKLFYKRYGLVFLLWFCYTPLIALLARSLAAHVRHSITTLLSGSVHVLMLSILVYTFRPSIADELYDLKESEVEDVHHDEELESILNNTDDL